MSAASPHPSTARELKTVLEAERAGAPFLLYRDEAGAHRLVELREPEDSITVGRKAENDIALDWDSQVSSTHAELQHVGGEWTVVDDGLSRNGTFLNGVRLSGRRRLRDRDTLRFGRTLVEYRDPEERGRSQTAVATDIPTADSLTDTQRKVLIALCRPYKDSHGFATPATNQAISDEIYLSVDAVKTHLRTLFRKFDLGDLPQNQKRARLVECAFQWGLVSDRDL
jgi:pSer/pThr/pTyr-binding forkhead associated (FHA) protein